MLKTIDLINATFSILNVKFANLAMFLLSWIEILNCYNIFNWLMLPVHWVKTFKLINNLLNLILLY